MSTETYDEEQLKFMNEEFVILVDPNDNITGKASKKESHLMENINKGMLHRAFSVFLFDQNDKLLLQKRASSKITFPNNWTNTCCSHPLDNISEEKEGIEGVKKAAQRKLLQELNIPVTTVPLEKFKFLTRIHYKAASGDSKWGEHEVDYILFIQVDHLDISPNRNEVSEVDWITIEGLQEYVEKAQKREIELTPWFGLIQDKFLVPWWNQLKRNTLKGGDNTVHHL